MVWFEFWKKQNKNQRIAFEYRYHIVTKYCNISVYSFQTFLLQLNFNLEPLTWFIYCNLLHRFAYLSARQHVFFFFLQGTFQQMWISKQEYEEGGKQCVDRKCPWFDILPQLSLLHLHHEASTSDPDSGTVTSHFVWFVFKTELVACQDLKKQNKTKHFNSSRSH